MKRVYEILATVLSKDPRIFVSFFCLTIQINNNLAYNLA